MIGSDLASSLKLGALAACVAVAGIIWWYRREEINDGKDNDDDDEAFDGPSVRAGLAAAQRRANELQQVPKTQASPAPTTFQVMAQSKCSNVGAVGRRCSVIITTSPVQSNPSTLLLSDLVGTFSLIKGLEDCPKIIVCDGYRVGEINKFRSGWVTAEKANDYEAFIKNVGELVVAGEKGFANSQLILLDKRLGFGNAVKTCLDHISTKHVMVIQHDRQFVRPFDFEKVLDAMDTDENVKYVGLHTSSTVGYTHKITSKYNILIKPRVVCGLDFLPMLCWYDSTHISTVEHYRNFVFGPRRLTKGNFIESDLGQAQVQDLRTRGLSSHEEYATFLLNDDDSRIVAHVDGRSFNEQYLNMK